MLNKIYFSLPIPFQNLAISTFGYYWYRRRFSGIYKCELLGFREREYFSIDQWREFQTVQLRRLLTHAFENVPFYKEKFSKFGFNIEHFKRFEIEDLPKLPILEKNDLRLFGKTTLLSAIKEKKGSFFSSSGSTGTPTSILYSNNFHQRVNAVMESRVRNWAGVSSNNSRGMIGGRRILENIHSKSPFFRYNFIEKQTYLSAYHISRANASNYRDGIIKYGVEYMTGYAMSNYLLASCFKELKLDLPQMKSVITSSEKLTPSMRSMFIDVYGCKTFDSYSGVENCNLFSETPEGDFVSNPDVGILELVDNHNQLVPNGVEGDIISTGFLNFDQPLIRYRIGDRAILSENQSTKCGRELPIIKELVGRIEDVIVTRDGKRMVRFHSLFLDIKYLIEAQIIQHSLIEFTINMVITNGFSNLEKDIILSRMYGLLGDGLSVDFVVLPSIPRAKNGKFKAVISQITE